jgi:hypothetical protein
MMDGRDDDYDNGMMGAMAIMITVLLLILLLWLWR